MRSTLSNDRFTLTCLLWDVDGTLTDTTSLIAESLDHIYRRFYGQTLAYDELRALIGTPLRSQIRVFGEPESFGVDSETVMAEFIAFYESQKSREKILTGVIELLVEGKRRGLRTALVTSKNREELDNTLPRLGIVEFIDLAVTADDVANPKPDPEGLRLALKTFGAVPEEAFYIGDTVHDMRAAQGADVKGIAVTWGAGPRLLLEAQSPAHLCDTPEQLRSILFPDPHSI